MESEIEPKVEYKKCPNCGKEIESIEYWTKIIRHGCIDFKDIVWGRPDYPSEFAGQGNNFHGLSDFEPKIITELHCLECHCIIQKHEEIIDIQTIFCEKCAGVMNKEWDLSKKYDISEEFWKQEEKKDATKKKRGSNGKPNQ